MLHVEDEDFAGFFVEAVPHAVLTAPGPPEPGEGQAQLSADNPRLPQKRPGDELARGEGGAGGQLLAQRTTGTW